MKRNSNFCKAAVAALAAGAICSSGISVAAARPITKDLAGEVSKVSLNQFGLKQVSCRRFGDRIPALINATGNSCGFTLNGSRVRVKDGVVIDPVVSLGVGTSEPGVLAPYVFVPLTKVAKTAVKSQMGPFKGAKASRYKKYSVGSVRGVRIYTQTGPDRKTVISINVQGNIPIDREHAIVDSVSRQLHID